VICTPCPQFWRPVEERTEDIQRANELLRLVFSLVEQLSGTIELDRTTGTAFTIVVKEKE